MSRTSRNANYTNSQNGSVESDRSDSSSGYQPGSGSGGVPPHSPRRKKKKRANSAPAFDITPQAPVVSSNLTATPLPLSLGVDKAREARPDSDTSKSYTDNSSLLPNHSASQQGSAFSETSAMCKLAGDDRAFKEYLKAVQCMREVDPQKPLSDEMREILGELPEMHDIYDLSPRAIMECLEPILMIYLSKAGTDKEMVQRRAQELYEDWNLTVGFDSVRKQLELASLATTARLQIPYRKSLLQLTLDDPKCSSLTPLSDEMLLSPYGHISAKWPLNESFWEPFGESELRRPLDDLLTSIWEATDCPNIRSRQERYTVPVQPQRSVLEICPGLFFKVDLTIVQQSVISSLDSALVSKYSSYWELLRYGKQGDPVSAELPLQVFEFKVKEQDFQQAENQCTAGLISGAAVNALLEIPFPIHGYVVTLERCVVYAARAQLTDGTIKYAVLKVREWGSLREYSNYIEFLRFLLNHKEWYMKTIYPLLPAKDDPMWVISKLKKASFSPWATGNVS